MGLLRIDKVICDSGIATRSEAKKLIASGRVYADGKKIASADTKVDAENSEICVDGQIINGKKHRYFIMNKPEGVLSATEDRMQKTVVDLLPPELSRLNLFPVGRLDKDTTGLIILTNDGDFCHEVTSPKHHIQKVYEFTVEGTLSEEDAEAFKQGIILRDGTKCMPAVLKIDNENKSHGFAAVFEGKYHQVKRMLASRGTPVIKLKRISIGGLKLNESLKPGEYQEIDENEIKILVNKNVSI